MASRNPPPQMLFPPRTPPMVFNGDRQNSPPHIRFSRQPLQLTFFTPGFFSYQPFVHPPSNVLGPGQRNLPIMLSLAGARIPPSIAEHVSPLHPLFFYSLHTTIWLPPANDLLLIYSVWCCEPVAFSSLADVFLPPPFFLSRFQASGRIL